MKTTDCDGIRRRWPLHKVYWTVVIRWVDCFFLFIFVFGLFAQLFFRLWTEMTSKNDAVVQRKITNSNKKKYLNATWVKSDSVIFLLLYFYAFLILMSCHVLHSKFLNFKFVGFVCVFILLKKFKSTRCCDNKTVVTKCPLAINLIFIRFSS